MDAHARKLLHYLNDDESMTGVIIELVKAGYGTPRLIKAATDRQLRAIVGVGKKMLAKIRETFPRIEAH